MTMHVDVKNRDDFFSKLKVNPVFRRNMVSLDVFKTLPFALLDDENVCEYAIQHNVKNFKSISDRLKTDNDFIRKIILHDKNPAFDSFKNVEVLKWCNKDVIDSKDFMLSLVKCGVVCYSHASKRLKNDTDFFVESIKNLEKNFTSLQVGKLFRSASETIQNNPDVLLKIYKEALLQYLTLSNGIIPLQKQHEVELVVKEERLTEEFYLKHLPSLIGGIEYRIDKNWGIDGQLHSLEYLCERISNSAIKDFIEKSPMNNKCISTSLNEILFRKDLKQISSDKTLGSKDKEITLKRSYSKKRKALKIA